MKLRRQRSSENHGRLGRSASAFAVIALILACLLPATAAQADTPHISTALYPAGARVTYLPALSNLQVDCNWSFPCKKGRPLLSRPLFHEETQDQLHRVAGWAQLATSGRGKHEVVFALYVSQYAGGTDAHGMPWNVRAFVDLGVATWVQGFTDLPRTPHLLPPGAVGNVMAEQQRSHDQDALLLAAWTGSTEVEGVAIYAHGSAPQRRVALRDLIRQVRAALS